MLLNNGMYEDEEALEKGRLDFEKFLKDRGFKDSDKYDKILHSFLLRLVDIFYEKGLEGFVDEVKENLLTDDKIATIVAIKLYLSAEEIFESIKEAW